MAAFAKRLVAKPEFGPFVLLVAMVFVFWHLNPAFLSLRNIGNTLAFSVELGLIALAMTLLMTSGEFDLSVGSLFGFSPVLMWTLFNTGFASIEISFIMALAAASGIGLISGLFVTRLKIPSFLVTLGMLLVVRGTALYVTNGFPQRTWNARDLWLAELLVGDFKVGDASSKSLNSRRVACSTSLKNPRRCSTSTRSRRTSSAASACATRCKELTSSKPRHVTRGGVRPCWPMRLRP